MDLGSEIRDPEKTYPGSRVKKAPDPGSAILVEVKKVNFIIRKGRSRMLL
jgi:hypothetical protein